jgi:hypothetical protein
MYKPWYPKQPLPMQVNNSKKNFKKNVIVIGFAVTFLFLSNLVQAEFPEMPNRLKAHVLGLTSTSAPRNYQNIQALEEASVYIEKELDSIGYKHRQQSFMSNKKTYHNIIAFYGDTTKPRIVIGAHYDVCDEQMGADDNASGVAGLIELARRFKSKGDTLEHCLEFVFYTLEEPPYFRTKAMGSYVHAKSMADAKVDVRLMVSLEMIGYFSDEKNSQHYPLPILRWLYPNEGDFIAVVSKNGNRGISRKFKKGIRRGSELPVEMLIAPPALAGVDFSDHLNYWFFGFTALMITDTAFMRNANYHTAGDTPETLDYKRMAEVVYGLHYTLKKYF